MSIFRNKKDLDDGLTPEERERVTEYTACFAGPAGSFVITDLYLLCGMATSIFNDVEFDPIQAAWRDGMQTIVKRILNYSGMTIYK